MTSVAVLVPGSEGDGNALEIQLAFLHGPLLERGRKEGCSGCRQQSSLIDRTIPTTESGSPESKCSYQDSCHLSSPSPCCPSAAARLPAPGIRPALVSCFGQGGGSGRVTSLSRADRFRAHEQSALCSSHIWGSYGRTCGMKPPSAWVPR